MLYIECKMGAAGDMLMSALYELLDSNQKNAFLEQMNQLFPGVICVKAETEKKCGITGTQLYIETLGMEETPEFSENHHMHHHNHEHQNEHEHHHDHEHQHNHEHHSHFSYEYILSKISSFPIQESVKKDVSEIYRILGDAEAIVHGTTLDNIHFHEVGSLDAIADITGCALLLSYLSPKHIFASPIHVGNGTVKCAHGVLPVPAPATAQILKGIPIYTGQIDSELCTPTAAAILKYYVEKYMPLPTTVVKAIGIGVGHKNFETANIVRVFNIEDNFVSNDPHFDQIVDISCNIDDMTGEELSFAMERFFEAGALDVFYTSIYMKKNRPAILLHVFCKVAEKDDYIKLILKHTSTRGIRYQLFDRVKLESSFEIIDVDGMSIKNKISQGFDICKQKLEFEDVKQYALAHDLSIAEARNELLNGK